MKFSNFSSGAGKNSSIYQRDLEGRTPSQNMQFFLTKSNATDLKVKNKDNLQAKQAKIILQSASLPFVHWGRRVFPDLSIFPDFSMTTVELSDFSSFPGQ